MILRRLATYLLLAAPAWAQLVRPDVLSPAPARVRPALRPYGTLRALAIGINAYQSRSIPALEWAERDASEVAAVLRDRYGFTAQTLLGANATKAAVDAALERYRKTVGPDDVLVLFLAGHGETVALRDGRRGFFLPFDVRVRPGNNAGLERWQAEAVDMFSIADWARALNCRHIVILVDSCFSGFVGARGGLSGKLNLDLLLSGHSRVVITAGTTGQSSFEGGSGVSHGWFSEALLSALDGRAAASVTELFLKVRDRVLERSSGLMTPTLRPLAAEGGEFVFVPSSLVRAAPTPEERARLEGLARVDALRRSAQADGEPVDVRSLYRMWDAKPYRFARDAADAGRRFSGEVRKLEREASLGNPIAMLSLVFCYRAGTGVTPDLATAGQWAAEARDADAGAPGQFAMSEALRWGLGTVRNAVAAEQLARESAASGFTPAGLRVALDTLARKPVSATDAAAAVAQLEAAAKDGSLTAATSLAVALYDGLPGIPADRARAMRLMTETAEAGHPRAQFALLQYWRTRKEFPLAVRWLTAAADNGLADAQADLAAAHYCVRGWQDYDIGLPLDFREARRWAELAAAQDHAQAHAMLAFMDRFGDGAPVNMEQARLHIDRAAALNFSEGLRLSGLWRLEGVVFPKDERAARALLEQAAATGSCQAMAQVAALTEGDRNQECRQLRFACDPPVKAVRLRIRSCACGIGDSCRAVERREIGGDLLKRALEDPAAREAWQKLGKPMP